jgi:hypothetical protein
MERRPAYCVYFASAMAVMLRTQGIPTRIVSGFVPGEVNPITGRVIIRERDAHAWVEVWSPEDQRFIAFDPTPSTSREQVIGTGEPPSMVSACVDAVASAVRRLRYQRDPARLLSDAAKSPVTWIVLSALAALLLKRRWTDAASAAAAPVLEASDPDLRRSYRRYVRALRRAGVAPRPSETDHELIDRLTAAGRPQLAARATEFITAYRRARYRGDVPDERLGELARLE